MKRISALLLLGIFNIIAIKSISQPLMQHVIATAGTEYQTSQYALSWTLGEAINSTFNADEYILTQGFHQPLAMAASLLGDANCDGEINVLDVVTLINHILGIDPFPFCPENADANGDSTIDILDAVTIINMILSHGKAIELSDITNPAHIYLCENGIDIRSDGNLAGLQFEFYGNIMGEIKPAIKGYELMHTTSSNRMKAVVINLANTPLPAGRIRLLNFTENLTELAWGQVKGANSSGHNILVFQHIEHSCIANPTGYTFDVYPNPNFGRFKLQMELPQQSDIKISLFDMLGNQTNILYEGKLEKGLHMLTFSPNQLSPGVYTLQIIARDAEGSHRKSFHKIIINKQ